MKVLIIGSRIPWPLRDGGAIATYNLLKGLSDKGIETDFISLNTSKHFASEEKIAKEFAFLSQVKTFFIDTSLSPLKAFINLFKSSSYNIERFTDSGFKDLIQETLNAKEYNVVHFEGLFVAQYAALVNCQCPKILRQHNIEYKIWESLAARHSGLKKFYLKFLASRLEKFEREIASSFEAIVSITEEDRQHTINELKYTGRTISISAGIEELPSLNQTINSHSIYHIGSMEWMPNQDAMKWFHDAIWPSIQNSNGEAKFYMAGKQMPESFKQWETENFKVLGEVENLQTFAADKSILVVPLRSGSGIRVKTIEAMMAGKAVVTTSFGAAGIPLVDGIHCLIADTASEFSNAVIRLLNDNQLRETLAKNGQLFASSQYSNTAVSENWFDFYKSLKR